MKRFYLILLVITLIGAGFRLYGITGQPPTDDEVFVAVTAHNYMERGHGFPTMPIHPRLRDILVYESLNTFGSGAFGLRGFSLCFGIITVPLLGLLLYRITKNMPASHLAAFFIAVDPAHITYSRQAIQEVHTTFFYLAGTLLIMLTSQTGRYQMKLLLLPLAGIMFGLGVGSKMHALFPAFVCFFFIIIPHIKARHYAMLCYIPLSLVLVPLVVHLLIDAPWLARGYDLREWIFAKKAILEAMTYKYVDPAMQTNIDKKAWQWFIVPLVGNTDFSIAGGKPFVSMSTGNFLVWLAVLPAAAWQMYHAVRTRSGLLLQALFWACYIPLLLSPRPIYFISSLAVAPFAFCLVAQTAADLAQKTGYKALYTYCALVFATTLFLYPLSIGKALEYRHTSAIVSSHDPDRSNRAP